jgi:hypothetical protein
MVDQSIDFAVSHATFAAMRTTLNGQLQSRPPLRAARVARGLGLREVARLAEIDPAHLSRVERGEARLSVDALGRLARVLELRDLATALAIYTRDHGDG